MNARSPALHEWQIDASRFAVLSRLADDLAHEIKNPLHAMVINLEVLKRRIEKGSSEAALERAGIVEQEVHRLNVLIDGLLRLLRPARDGEGPTSVSRVVEDVQPLIELRARLARIEFNTDGLAVDAYTAVRPTALRFALLMISEQVLDLVREARLPVLLTVALQAEEIQIGLSWTGAAPALGLEEWDGLGGIPAAAALLEPAGGSVEVSAGTGVLVRVPRVQFI